MGSGEKRVEKIVRRERRVEGRERGVESVEK